MGTPREPVFYPRVRFAPDFVPRARAFALRAARRRAVREAAGARHERGAGDDLLGLRAYRPGDDPRAIDWTASARRHEPVVRVLRRPRGGREAIVLDASLSMAVGPPGKLARAAEVAAALALASTRAGARVTVMVLPHAVRLPIGRPQDLDALVTTLAGIEARGALARPLRVVDGFDALTWIGDLCGLAPSELATAVRRGADLAVLQILAPHEIAPHFDGSVTLVEPESGARLVAGPAALVAHAHELETQRAAFAAALTRRGARFARASSAESFEAAAARLFIP